MKSSAMLAVIFVLAFVAAPASAQPPVENSSSVINNAGYDISTGIVMLNKADGVRVEGYSGGFAKVAETGVDGLTTGGRVSRGQYKAYQDRRKKYLACPKCIAKQPFPGE